MALARVLFLPAAFFACFVACSASPSAGEAGVTDTDAGSPVDAPTARDGDDAGADAASAPSLGACAHFVACAEATEPSAAVGARAAYGPDGACFHTEAKSFCEDACRKGLQGLHTLHPKSKACALCERKADCPASSPVCAADIGECVECAASTDCKLPTAACDSTTRRCVRCASDTDCKDSTPACDIASHTCVACSFPSHCKSGLCYADHSCCIADNPCTSGICGMVRNSCGQPVACGDCPASSYCSDSACQPVTTRYDCNTSFQRQTCAKTVEYCDRYTFGGDSYGDCKSASAACAAHLTCDCMRAQNAIPALAKCSEGVGRNGIGTIYVWSRD